MTVRKGGLRDYRPRTGVVVIEDAEGPMEIGIRAMPFEIIIDIVANDPVLSGFLLRKGFDPSEITGTLLRSPSSLARIIAAGTGKPDDEEEMAYIRSEIPLDQQVEIAFGIINLTLGGDPAGFIVRIAEKLAILMGADPATLNETATETATA